MPSSKARHDYYTLRHKSGVHRLITLSSSLLGKRERLLGKAHTFNSFFHCKLSENPKLKPQHLPLTMYAWNVPKQCLAQSQGRALSGMPWAACPAWRQED